MKKFKIPLFALAFCIALAASFAFSLPDKNAKKFDVYYYMDTSVEFDVMSNPGNWLTGQTAHGSCNTDEGTIPCTLEPSGDLGTYLSNLGTSNAIVGASITKRTP